jgi:Tfp pilus assembly protein PilZ
MGTEQEHRYEFLWNGVLAAAVESSHQKGDCPMMKIAFIAAAAVAVLTTAPVITPAKAQGVDVQLGRDRDRDYDRRRNDTTIGIGPGGVTVGPRERCRTVTTRVERDDGRMITRKERRCD